MAKLAKTLVQQEMEVQRDDMLEYFDRHVLTGQGGFLRMGRPNTNMYSVFLTELGGRVVITGDTVIEHHGVISSPGYNLDWFAKSANDPHYLAEKFLQQGYDPLRAELEIANWLRDHHESPRDQWLTPDEVSALQTLKKDGVYDKQTVSSACYKVGMYESVPGFGYAVVAMGNLWAVALTYRRLYNALSE